MNITATEQQGVLVLTVEGKPNRQFLEHFKKAADPRRKIVMHMAKAEAFLGDDIEDLVSAHSLCEQAGGSLVLTQLPRDLGYILNLLSLDQFFCIAASVDAAAEQLVKAQGAMAMTTLRMIAIQSSRLKDKSAGADPEEAARAMVAQVKVSMRYLAPTPMRVKLLQFFEELGPAELSVAEAADAIKEPVREVQEAFNRLEGLRVLVKGRRGLLRYAPGPQTKQGIEAIVQMWADEGSRAKMLSWAATDVDGDLVVVDPDE